jgi:pimeloyl-ACP methyl ester carboxylesterase
MATFVFVPGAWHGGWCWRRVAEPLRAAGHQVLTPTLTGIGERAHLFSPAVDLETHISDVLAVLEWEDLSGVVLVGHSYGGMVITGVADRVPKRLSRLVYLDALWPENGESVCDIIGEEIQNVVRAQVDPANPPRIEGASEIARKLGVIDPQDIDWVASKLTPQPPASMTQAVRLKHVTPSVPALFIACNQTYLRGVRLSRMRAQARAGEGPPVKIVNLEAPHNAMITHPNQVVELLSNG